MAVLGLFVDAHVTFHVLVCLQHLKSDLRYEDVA
jgi:hypothetical protein